MSQELNKLLENPLIAQTKLDYIKSEFIDFTSVAEEWKDKAYSIVVTDEKQLDLMEQAKEGKKLLKAKRIEIEKKRKLLKEQSLNEGRLIDSVAKYLTSLIEPAEKYLELQEKYAETKEWERKQILKRERYLLLEPYFDVIDPNTIQLDIISEEAFTTILNGAKYGLEQKRAEEKRLEEERIAEIEKERLEKETMQNELNSERERSQAIQKALDQSKKNERTATIKLKEVAVELKTIKKTQSQIIEAVDDFDSELELLKAKCELYETTLKKVLFYIIPDPCRYVVEKAIEHGKTNFNKDNYK
jgi:hypothetical protein